MRSTLLTSDQRDGWAKIPRLSGAIHEEARVILLGPAFHTVYVFKTTEDDATLNVRRIKANHRVSNSEFRSGFVRIYFPSSQLRTHSVIKYHHPWASYRTFAGKRSTRDTSLLFAPRWPRCKEKSRHFACELVSFPYTFYSIGLNEVE